MIIVKDMENAQNAKHIIEAAAIVLSVGSEDLNRIKLMF